MMGPNDTVVKRVMEKGIKPAVSDRVILLIDEIKKELKLPSGIIVLQVTAEETSTRSATVIAIGDEVKSVSKGDRIVLGKFYGLAIPHEDSDTCKMVVVSEDQIDALLIEE